MGSATEITALLEAVAESLEDAEHGEMDVEEQVAVYGRAERARGVMLAYQAAHEQAAADVAGDSPVGWSGRLRAAWRTLRGEDAGAGGGPALAPALESDARETGDALAAYADDLQECLADHGDDDGAGSGAASRGFY